MKNIPVRGELQNKLTFFVLANDEASLKAAQTNDLFKQADVVQVIMDDLHRVGSALKDMVERSLFFNLVRQHSDKLLLTYPAAAYFQKEKLHMLVTEAIAEVDKVFQSVQVPWFIFENFEARYGYFIKLARKMLKDSLQAGDALQEWKSFGLPLDDPFSENTLKEQFDLIASAT